MSKGPYQRALEALYAAGGTPVIVGGFALVMHGVSRFTPDINVAMDLSQKYSVDAVDNLLTARFSIDNGGSPKDLFNETNRARWIKEGKRFFSIKDPESPPLSVEIFLEPPMPLATLQQAGITLKAMEQKFTICSIDHLVTMKEIAKRPQDKADLENLKLLQLILAAQSSGLGAESLLVAPPPGYSRDQVENLVHFLKTSVDERVNWLTEMLSAMGMFCVF